MITAKRPTYQSTSTPPPPVASVRLTLELSPGTVEIARGIAEQMGQTIAETVTQALRVLHTNRQSSGLIRHG
jgi:hypothetical protein